MQNGVTDQTRSDATITISSIRILLLVSIILNIWAIVDGMRNAYGIGSVLGFSGSMLIRLWPYALMLGMVLLVYIFTYTHWVKHLEKIINTIGRPISSLGPFNWVLFLIPILGYGYYRLTGFSLRFIGFFDPLWVIGHLALLGSVFLWGTNKVSSSLSILISLTFYGCMLWIFSFFPEINDYPLSLGWSETSRYYYASLFLSPIIYGRWVPLSSLHPSRYLMQAVPFLLQSNSLLFHRFWQSFIWVLTTFTAGYVLTRRLKLKNKWIIFSLAAWFFLFVFQGPVYYHLMVIIIIVLIGFDKDRLWRSLLIVVLASLWAGISRVNWFPVPGMLAVTLYVLEKPQKEESFWSYWGWPVIAVFVSLLGAFGSQYIYARISGNPVEVFASSFNSPLYRYRLFPNEAFGPGVIMMTINACFPLLVLLLWKLIPSLKTWKILRILALVSILGALLAAGLIVSMKIGGGDNLHNLDAFMVFLAIITTYIFLNKFAQDNESAKKEVGFIQLPFIILAILIPLNFIVNSLVPLKNYDDESAWAVVDQIQNLINQNTSENDEVLFIDQRHLLTFDMIEGVDLVPEYEKVFLMEMAMANNEAYLTNFWREIEEHRFALIVSEKLTSRIRPSTDVFGEENNVWVERISKPLLNSYYTIFEFPEYNISILVPKR
jgi:hypothetical protein